MRIEYDERVLEPRPWTLGQAEWAARLLADAPPGPVLELCTGAGQIGLAAASLSGRDAVLVDASEVACDFARANAAAAGLTARIDVRRAPMLEALAPHERFALVLADPPYIPSTGTASFPDDPLTAIDGGEDGLAIARMCLAVAARHLEEGGAVLLQLRDEDQARTLGGEEPVRSWFEPVEVRSFDGRGAVLLLARTGHAGPAGSVLC